MKVFEFKLYGEQNQFEAIDRAIRTTQFIRNSCLAVWMDNGKKPRHERAKIGKFDFNNYATALAHQHDFVAKLGSQARQAAAERAWLAVSRFYENCKKKKPGKKGYPKFRHNVRSVEYKQAGWKLSKEFKQLKITDKNEIGTLRMRGGRQLTQGDVDNIKRVRLVKKANGYFVQFNIALPNVEHVAPTGQAIGLDVGLESFYVDSNAERVENPRFLRKSERKLKFLQRRVSRKKKGSKNRKKAIKKLAKKHNKVSCQRKDFAVKTARCVVKSNDFVAIENLKVRNMVRNRKLAKSISDVSWRMFRTYLEYFGAKFGKTVIAVDPRNTSQRCSKCGKLPTKNKTLDVREHDCEFCGYKTHRDHNSAIEVLQLGLSTAGHAGIHAWGNLASTSCHGNGTMQVELLNQEPPVSSETGIPVL